MMKGISRAAVGAVVLLVAAVPATVHAQWDGIDPAAVARLESATDFLAAQNRFSVDTESVLEAVLETGQKIEFGFVVSLAVERPDKLRAERHSELVHQVFIYDGASLTLFNPDDGYYATRAAPATIEGMLDFAREKLDIVAPAGDLVYSNAFEILMDDVTTAFIVGDAVVEEVRCDHLAFRNPSTDWQIWIQQGEQPLIRKMVITSADIVGQPEFRIVMTSWDLAPAFPDAYFTFDAPEDAVAIEFLPAAAGGDPSE
jgi:hypothetical protein